MGRKKIFRGKGCKVLTLPYLTLPYLTLRGWRVTASAEASNEPSARPRIRIDLYVTRTSWSFHSFISFIRLFARIKCTQLTNPDRKTRAGQWTVRSKRH